VASENLSNGAAQFRRESLIPQRSPDRVIRCLVHPAWQKNGDMKLLDKNHSSHRCVSSPFSFRPMKTAGGQSTSARQPVLVQMQDF
jgi:hypothetical protein